MVEELLDQSLSVLSSKGFWRLAWKQQENLVGSVGSIHVTVWKTLKIEHNFDEAYYEHNRVDAVAMETLTASRNIIDIYAICGTSVVTEFAGKNFETLVNRLDSIQRLKMAIQVAQGVADVHGITSNMPSLVHNDLNPANLVLTQDNRAVLNDFNIAVLLMKHNETNEPCPFLSRFPNPRWRAPEEQVASEDESTHNPPRGTEKVDIYALGNIFYRLAIGSTPWKVPHTHKVTPKQKAIIVHLKRSTGALPPIPHCIEEYPDPAVHVLLEAMRRAYRHQPANRPSAKSLVQFLTSSLKEIRAMNLTGHELLWDGVRSSRKRNVAMLSVNSTEHVAQLFIGNANCSVDSTGKPTSLKTLMKY
ncbi:hypothetical protein MPSEU_000404200 [Mayamaea pseudoterrestris]|nr:hypothetical protein MPSEU_000404200 [Mayamaea pseudoterrestris]